MCRPIGASAGLALALACLTAGETRIWSLVQFFQIREAVNYQLLRIALSRGREGFEISADFLPRIGNALSIKWTDQLIGIQNTLNQVIHPAPKQYAPQ
jgi:hypothetical protein